jgi:hypothetical protein
MSPTFGLVSRGGVPKATITGTTGSPVVDTSSRPGKTIYKFTGSGSITVGTAGTAEVLIIGGGGGGGGNSPGSGGGDTNPGGGAGGLVYDDTAFLKSGTLIVTVGAGGASGSGQPRYGNPGGPSRIDKIVALGGGAADGNGGSGGGSGSYTNVRFGFSGQGNNGGYLVSPNAYQGWPGGGGAGAVGNNVTGAASPVNAYGATGGAGLANSITGSSVTYAGGGGGANYYIVNSSTRNAGGAGGGGASGATANDGSYNPALGSGIAGTANSGSGGGGSGISYSAGSPATQVGGSGGSGYVVVVIG